MERITDILKLGREKEVGISDIVKKKMEELREELFRNYNYLKQLEEKSDDKIVLSELDHQNYQNLSYIAHSSDEILNRVNNIVASSHQKFSFRKKHRQSFRDNLRILSSAADIAFKHGHKYRPRNMELLLEYSAFQADSSHEIHGVTSNADVAKDIYNLVKQIQKYSYNSSPSSSTYILNTGGNINHPYSKQIIGSTYFYLNDNKAPQMKQDSRPKSFGHYPNPHLVGFDHEIQTLLNHLLQTYDATRFVGIVGMGGSGKTTLARHIYHNSDINTHFDLKVWVCISQFWDKTSILNQIYSQANRDTLTTEMTYEKVVPELYTFLSSKSYLIILDDIWSIDVWTHICQAFPGKGRSAVVVTTRKNHFLKIIDPTILIVEPKQLNDEDSYKLFKLIAPLLDKNTPHDLLSLGMKMVKKCKGLPLAIITLAGVLQMNTNRSTWERISERLTQHILTKKDASKEGVVKEVLALSYDELPHHLKPCALYLHVFPEDYEIKAQKLIQMWIAECFMDESTAEEYLDELAQRSIVVVVRTNYEGKVLEFRIHDLMRQMFIDIDKERDFFKNPSLRLVPRTTQGYLDTSSHFRSLIHLHVKPVLMRPLIIKRKLLRVLVLDQFPLNGFSDRIGDLIHLRYLELSAKGHRYIPRCIENLENLLTLDLRNFDSLRCKINFEKMKELRHLYMLMNGYNNRKMEVMGLEKLKKLKTLWVAEGGEWMLSVMPELSDVLQELYIGGIGKQNELEVVFRSPSISTNNLHTLVLNWNSNSDLKFCNMSILRNCKCLKQLKLEGEIEEGTPIMFPPNLLQLEMKFTIIREKQVLNIISESCAQLKVLTFDFMAYRGTELVCDENSFPQLEKLTFEGLFFLKRWIIGRGAMPRLNDLTICRCSNLDIDDQGCERISTIPKLKVLNGLNKKLQKYRNDLFIASENQKIGMKPS